jgi:hypothetical protein
MILYTLRCEAGHGFEAWFRNSSTYDAQAAGAEIACPVCGDTRIGKAPMAPAVARGHGVRRAETHSNMAEVRKVIEKLQRYVEENCDYVGDRFAEEARRIHYREAEHRDIYGEATSEEAESLRDEGIAVSRIPWLPRTDS